MKKLIPFILLSLVLVSCGEKYTPEIVQAPIPPDINSPIVLEVQNALKCGENYSDECSYVFGKCGGSDFPNTFYYSYSECVYGQFLLINE